MKAVADRFGSAAAAVRAPERGGGRAADAAGPAGRSRRHRRRGPRRPARPGPARPGRDPDGRPAPAPARPAPRPRAPGSSGAVPAALVGRDHVRLRTLLRPAGRPQVQVTGPASAVARFRSAAAASGLRIAAPAEGQEEAARATDDGPARRLPQPLGPRRRGRRDGHALRPGPQHAPGSRSSPPSARRPAHAGPGLGAPRPRHRPGPPARPRRQPPSLRLLTPADPSPMQQFSRRVVAEVTGRRVGCRVGQSTS